MHWLGNKPEPDTHYGFIYVIINNVTNQLYIGKKAYWYPKKKRSYWENYIGSSKHLLSAMEEYGKDKFTFYILVNCKTKGWWTYVECNLQHRLNVLIQMMDESTPRFYNKQIGAIKYIPKIENLHILAPSKNPTITMINKELKKIYVQR